MCQAKKVEELFEAIEQLSKAKYPGCSATFEVGILRGEIRNILVSKDPMKEIENSTRYYNQQLAIIRQMEKK